MKKTIIVLVLLFVCFSVFADSNPKWIYYSHDIEYVYHQSNDFILLQNDEVKCSAVNDVEGKGDFEEGTYVEICFYAQDFLTFFYTGIKEGEVAFVRYADSFDDLKETGGTVFDVYFWLDDSCALNAKSSAFIYNQLAYYNTNGQGCVAIVFKDNTALVFNVNCTIFNQYTYLIDNSFYD